MGGFKLGKMTLGSLFKKPETVLYPVEKKETPAGLKGHIVNDVDVCILCGTCVLECPKHCLSMEPGWPAPSKKMYIETFDVPEHAKPVKKVS